MHDIKCTHHPKKDIIFVCLQCDNQPICSICLSSNHKKHDFESVETLDDNLKSRLTEEFNNKILKQLVQHSDDKKSVLDKSNIKIKEIEDQHTINLSSIKQQFKQLYDILGLVELDLTKQLITKLDENKQTNIIIQSTIDDLQKIIDTIVNKYNNNNTNNYNNEDQEQDKFIETLKHYHQCKSIINNNNEELSEYNETTINVNQDSIQSIKDTIKSIIQISNKNLSKPITPITPVEVTINKKFKTTRYWGHEFTIYEDGSEIPEGTRYLAIEHGHHLPHLFPDSVYWLLLPDGFDCQSLQSLPSTISILDIFNIKYNLFPGSIPNSIKFLLFGEGFDQKLTKGIIPSSLERLDLCNILHPLDNDSIPETVNCVFTSESFKHPIKEILPKNVNLGQNNFWESVKYSY